MNEHINLTTRIRNLFDELNRLSFWQRIFYWKTFKKDFYEGAKEDLIKLEFIQEQAFSFAKDLNNEKDENADLKSKLKRDEETVVKLNQTLNEKNEKIAELNQQKNSDFEAIKKLEAKNQSLNEKVVELTRLNAEFAQREEQRIKEEANHIKALQKSTEITEKTGQQLIESDKKSKELEAVNRSRIWKDHQDRTNAKLQGLCQTTEYLFRCYDDKNPPTAFADLKLKPDFCIELFDEFVIFDSKTPSSPESNLDEYLKNQVKESAKKYTKASQVVHKSIFFVIPSEEISRVKETIFKEGSFKFHIITPEAIEPILANYKKVEGYEIADKLNPEDREELISLIAKYDNHIMRRNQIDLFLIDHGFRTMSAKMNIPEDFKDAIFEKQNVELINPPTQSRKRKISLENITREHQQLIGEAKIKSLPSVAEIEYKETD